MKKILLIISLLVFGISPATADITFKQVTGDSKTVGILFTPNGQPNCGGALVAPRIVYTAAHCVARVFKNETMYQTNTQNRPIESGNITDKFLDLYVTYPGIEVPAGGTDKKVKVIAQFVSSKYKDSSYACATDPNKDCHPSLFDFAVLILEHEIKTNPVRFATSNEIEQLIVSNSKIYGIGYGTKDWSEEYNFMIGKPSTRNPIEYIVTLRNENDQLFSNTKRLNYPYKRFMTIETLYLNQSVPGPGAISGSPLFANINNEDVYIGAMSASNGPYAQMDPNNPIWKDSFWSKNAGGEYYTAQAFVDIINDANEYLLSIKSKIVSVENTNIIKETLQPSSSQIPLVVSKSNISKKTICPKTKKSVSKACKV